MSLRRSRPRPLCIVCILHFLPPSRFGWDRGMGFSWNQEDQITDIGISGFRDSDYLLSYDALGRRVTFDTNTYTYDGNDVILDGSPATHYQNAPGIDDKLSLKSGTSTSYFLQDHLGSTVGLADGSGAVTETNSYDSFGNPTNPFLSTRYQFTGREYDVNSGLQYNRARWYDPSIGRFISEDPIGF